MTEDVAGATIDSLVPIDYSRNDTLTMSVTSDNSANNIFEVSGTTLKIKDTEVADYEETSQYNITVQVTDDAGLTVSRNFQH